MCTELVRIAWLATVLALCAACDPIPMDAGLDGGSLCGNLVLDPDEQCEPGGGGASSIFRVKKCHSGTLVCRANCTLDPVACAAFCGDGVVNGGEQCDGTAAGKTIHCPKGHWACKADCTLDLSACKEECGDGVITPPNEQCDGAVFHSACTTSPACSPAPPPARSTPAAAPPTAATTSATATRTATAWTYPPATRSTAR